MNLVIFYLYDIHSARIFWALSNANLRFTKLLLFQNLDGKNYGFFLIADIFKIFLDIPLQVWYKIFTKCFYRVLKFQMATLLIF